MENLKKFKLNYVRLAPFQISEVGGAQWVRLAPRHTMQGCNGGEQQTTYANLANSEIEHSLSRQKAVTFRLVQDLR